MRARSDCPRYAARPRPVHPEQTLHNANVSEYDNSAVTPNALDHPERHPSATCTLAAPHADGCAAPGERRNSPTVQQTADRLRDALCAPALSILDDLVDPEVDWASAAPTLHPLPGRHDVVSIDGRWLRLGSHASVGDITIRGRRIIVCLTVRPTLISSDARLP